MRPERCSTDPICASSACRSDALIATVRDWLRAAGTSAERIAEIHGTTREVVCMDCGERAPMEPALARVRGGEEDPPCRSCR